MQMISCLIFVFTESMSQPLLSKLPCMDPYKKAGMHRPVVRREKKGFSVLSRGNLCSKTVHAIHENMEVKYFSLTIRSPPVKPTLV